MSGQKAVRVGIDNLLPHAKEKTIVISDLMLINKYDLGIHSK